MAEAGLLSLSLSLGALLIEFFSLSVCSPLTTVKLPDGSSAKFNQKQYDISTKYFNAEWLERKVEYGVPVVLARYSLGQYYRPYRCQHIAHSGGEYAYPGGKYLDAKIAYIDPKDIEVWFVTSKGAKQQMNLVDGLMYCTGFLEPAIHSDSVYIEVVAKNLLFSDTLFYLSRLRGIGDEDSSDIEPTADPTSYTSRAVANQVVGITGMPTLAEVEAEMERMRPIFVEQAKIGEEKRLKNEQAKIAEQERLKAEEARVARQSYAYQAGYRNGLSSSSNVVVPMMLCNSSYLRYADKEDCIQGIRDGLKAQQNGLK